MKKIFLFTRLIERSSLSIIFILKKKKKNYIKTEKNIIYVADNLGYLYSLNYEMKKLVWAKNFKIPLRSNKNNQNKLMLLIR